MSMSNSRASLSLRNVLLLDAATCVGMGAALTLGSRPLGAATELPIALLFWAGLSLFPIAALMAFVATRPAIGSTATRLLIGGNLAWIAASALLLASGWARPNALGTAFVVGQALAVALLSWLEYAALRGGSQALQPAGR
jgi:hypothetical protein